jgi:hypothetical protein
LENIEYAAHVINWLQKVDVQKQYKQAFTTKIIRIGNGERNYSLSKELKGCSVKIFETRLSMAYGGLRMLWQERYDENNVDKPAGKQCSILVWYVVHHDLVSRKLRLIEQKTEEYKAKIESAYSRIPKAYRPKDSNHTPEILLDPEKNTPIQIYTVKTRELVAFQENQMDFATWHPDLRLTRQEFDIVFNRNAHCILGRSGTGKTVCVVARIIKDRERQSTQSHLFIARSSKLRDHVKREVENRKKGTTVLLSDRRTKSFKEKTALSTLDEFNDFVIKKFRLENAAFAGKSPHDWYSNQNRKVAFTRFEQTCWKSLYDAEEVKAFKRKHASDIALTPMLVWGEIRSFIKGSTHAAMTGVPLTEEEYCGKEQRKRETKEMKEWKPEIYKIFKRYQSHLKKNELWDEMDRALAVCSGLKREIELELSRSGNKNTYLEKIGLPFDKIYVDEVQDTTQAELCMLGFCCIGNPDDMFFAGDTAQTIEQGANFQFHDMRIMAHHVFPKSDMELHGISKKQYLTHNYRSHKGILDVASELILKLCTYFEEGIDKAKDDGIGEGPRPEIVIGEENAKRVLAADERWVVLVRDDNEDVAKNIKQKIAADDQETDGGSHDTFGIREFKGMEMPLICIYGFFSFAGAAGATAAEGGSISAGMSMADDSNTHLWGKMLKWQEGDEIKRRPIIPLSMEYELKLLYTAITRSQSKLIFIEPDAKKAEPFSKWLRDSLQLATDFNIDQLPPKVVEEASGGAKHGGSMAGSKKSGTGGEQQPQRTRLSADERLQRGAKYASQVIGEWVTDDKLPWLEEGELRAKFAQAIQNFEQAGKVGKERLGTLLKQITLFETQAAFKRKQRELDKRKTEFVPFVGEPTRADVKAGDVIIFTAQLESNKGEIFPKGVLADVVEVPRGASVKIKVVVRPDQKPMELKLSQFRLLGPSTIDAKVEGEVMQLVKEAIGCTRFDDALELLDMARGLPLDDTQSAGEEGEASADEGEAPKGWLARRGAFFDQLETKIEARREEVERVSA